MGIFSKSNSNEYNNELEAILENKKFKSETKSLLLSMLYKIETSYKDYHTVKSDTDTKEEFIKKLLYIIENECEEIVTVTPKTEVSMPLEAARKNSIIDVSLGKILVYANEKDLLYAILELDIEFSQYRNNKKYNFDRIEEEKILLFEAVQKFLVKSSAMEGSEIIRDFNGWSWDTNTKDIENITENLLYQNISLLLGNKIRKEILLAEPPMNTINEDINSQDLRPINDTTYEEKEIKEDDDEKKANDYINVIYRAFNDMYLEEKVEDIVNDINIIALVMSAKESSKVAMKLKKIYQDTNEKLDLMKNKTKFLNEITKRKKVINEKIKNIDKMLNNRDLLREEYDLRNEKLANEDKIFSISHLAKMLEIEREDLLLELRKDNKLLEPMEYITEKDKLEKESKFITSVINAMENSNFMSDLVKQTQIEFIKCFIIQIEQAESKVELINLLYKFRYYCLLPINELQKIRDVPEFKDGIKEVVNILIDKCIDTKVIENISNSASLCYNILKYLFESRIIDLKEIYIKVIKNKEETVQQEEQKPNEKIYYITVSYYDIKEEEEEHSGEVNNLLLLNIKLNKKIQLFL